MNRNSQEQESDLSSPLLRRILATPAVAATLATLASIDALAHGAGTPESTTAHHPIVVARR